MNMKKDIVQHLILVRHYIRGIVVISLDPREHREQILMIHVQYLTYFLKNEFNILAARCRT